MSDLGVLQEIALMHLGPLLPVAARTLASAASTNHPDDGEPPDVRNALPDVEPHFLRAVWDVLASTGWPGLTGSEIDYLLGL